MSLGLKIIDSFIFTIYVNNVVKTSVAVLSTVYVLPTHMGLPNDVFKQRGEQ